MNEDFMRRLKAAGLLSAYGLALYAAGADSEKTSEMNDIFDGSAAAVVAASGFTGTASYINLSPCTVVDNQFFNLDAAYASARNLTGDKEDNG